MAPRGAIHAAMLAAAIVIASGPLHLQAATMGMISGRVLEESGKPVGGAKVILTADGWRRVVTCDSAGRFVILGIPFRERYSVYASGRGYAHGTLGAIYPDIPVAVEMMLYDGPSFGPCGSVLAKRTGTTVTFSVPSTPAQIPSVCL